MKFAHMGSETKNPGFGTTVAIWRSHSLSNSMVKATRTCESSVGSGGSGTVDDVSNAWAAEPRASPGRVTRGSRHRRGAQFDIVEQRVEVKMADLGVMAPSDLPGAILWCGRPRRG